MLNQIEHNIVIDINKMVVQLKSSLQLQNTISVQDSEAVRSAILQFVELKSKDIPKNSDVSESQISQIEQKFSVLFISKSSSHWIIYGNNLNSIDFASSEYSFSSPISSPSFSSPSFSTPSFQVFFFFFHIYNI